MGFPFLSNKTSWAGRWEHATVQGSTRQCNEVVRGVVLFPRACISSYGVSGPAHGLWSQGAWIYILAVWP